MPSCSKNGGSASVVTSRVPRAVGMKFSYGCLPALEARRPRSPRSFYCPPLRSRPSGDPDRRSGDGGRRECIFLVPPCNLYLTDSSERAGREVWHAARIALLTVSPARRGARGHGGARGTDRPRVAAHRPERGAGGGPAGGREPRAADLGGRGRDGRCPGAWRPSRSRGPAATAFPAASPLGVPFPSSPLERSGAADRPPRREHAELAHKLDDSERLS